MYAAALKGLLRLINFNLRRNLYGRRWRIPVVGGTGIDLLREQEAEFIPLISHILDQRRGTVIDVGANLGQSLLKLKSVDLERNYIAFEPNMRCCSYLARLIRRNRIPHCEIYPLAMLDRPGVRLLHSDGATGQGATVVDGFRDPGFYGHTERVAGLTLDDFLGYRKPGDIALIKIDVEGGESGVLAGAKDCLREHRPFIICEILPTYDESTPAGMERRARQDLVIQILRRLDYQVFRILAGGGLRAITAIEAHSDVDRCNYFFSPSEFAEPLPGQVD
jgi:FkbM family methyltransferase